MPGGRAAEQLAITHSKELRCAVRRAQRIGSDTSLGRLIDQCHELLPLIGFTGCLAQIVVHHSAARGLREPTHETIFQLSITSTTALDNASAHLSQDIA